MSTLSTYLSFGIFKTFWSFQDKSPDVFLLIDIFNGLATQVNKHVQLTLLCLMKVKIPILGNCIYAYSILLEFYSGWMPIKIYASSYFIS